MNPKHLLVALALCGAVLSPSAALGQGPKPAATPMQGEVLEVINVESYTYLRLQTAAGPTWAAVPTASVKAGAKVTIVNTMTMNDFESKSLKRRFDRIVFGQLATTGAAAAPSMTTRPAPSMVGAAAPNKEQMSSAHTGLATPMSVMKVPKATGADARTVAEVVDGRKGLKDKAVVVRGRVVKANMGIMGKNWLHLQDGSGDQGKGSHDVLVTTRDAAALGDIVTARGTVRTDVNIGPGYAYEVLIEDAAVKK